MRDVQEQLREFSRSLVESLPDVEPDSVMDPVIRPDYRPKARSWRVLTAVAGLMAVAVVVIPMLMFPGQPPATTDPISGPVTTVAPPATTLAPIDGPPSQSPADALRDGVAPAVAAVPLEHRVTRLVEVSAPEGTWVLSRVSEEYVIRVLDHELNFPEYGEILLLDTDGGILRAYPKPAFPPDWITVTDNYVYAGRIGDGGLPNSSLVRIDRGTLDADMVGLPTGGEAYPGGWPAGWYDGSQEHADRFGVVVGFARQGMVGTPVVSQIGEVVVDIPGVDGLINEVILHGGTPSQSASEARRDGVVPALAAIRSSLRVGGAWGVEVVGEGFWLAAGPTQKLIEMTSVDGCALGDPDGVYALDVICTVEYGEILLVDFDDQILRAFPMPGAPPTWVAVSERFVYAGRVGDGALPHSTLVRIDRSTMEWVVVVVPTGHEFYQWPPDWIVWPENWHLAHEDDVGRYMEVVEPAPQLTGTEVDGLAGLVVVDLAGIEALINEVVGR